MTAKKAQTLLTATMQKLTDVLNMGGYAIYVWPSFLVTALAMLAMVIVSMRALRRAQKTLAELQKTMTTSIDW